MVGWLAHHSIAQSSFTVYGEHKPLNVFFFLPRAYILPLLSSFMNRKEETRRTPKKRGREDTAMDLKKTVTEQSPFFAVPTEWFIEACHRSSDTSGDQSISRPLFWHLYGLSSKPDLNNECKQYTGRRCGVADHTRLGSRLDQLEDMASPSMTHHPPP